MPKKFDKAKWNHIKTQHGGKHAHHTERMEKALAAQSTKIGRQFAAITTGLACLLEEFSSGGMEAALME